MMPSMNDRSGLITEGHAQSSRVPRQPQQQSMPQTQIQANAAPSAQLAGHQTSIGSDSLVENRLTGLLNSDNPYMQQAETRGLQQANARGLISSSLAVGAVEGARINAALPIAQQDASLYGQSNLQDSAYTQQGNLNTQTYQNTSNLNNQQGQINSQLASHQGQINSQLNEQSAATQFQNQSSLQAQSSIQSMQNQLAVTIGNIQTDPNMSPQQRDDAIQTQLSIHNAAVAATTRAGQLATSSFIYMDRSTQPNVGAPEATAVAGQPRPGDPRYDPTRPAHRQDRNIYDERD